MGDNFNNQQNLVDELIKKQLLEQNQQQANKAQEGKINQETEVIYQEKEKQDNEGNTLLKEGQPYEPGGLDIPDIKVKIPRLRIKERLKKKFPRLYKAYKIAKYTTLVIGITLGWAIWFMPQWFFNYLITPMVLNSQIESDNQYTIATRHFTIKVDIFDNGYKEFYEMRDYIMSSKDIYMSKDKQVVSEAIDYKGAEFQGDYDHDGIIDSKYIYDNTKNGLKNYIDEKLESIEQINNEKPKQTKVYHDFNSLSDNPTYDNVFLAMLSDTDTIVEELILEPSSVAYDSIQDILDFNWDFEFSTELANDYYACYDTNGVFAIYNSEWTPMIVILPRGISIGFSILGETPISSFDNIRNIDEHIQKVTTSYNDAYSLELFAYDGVIVTARLVFQP